MDMVRGRVKLATCRHIGRVNRRKSADRAFKSLALCGNLAEERPNSGFWGVGYIVLSTDGHPMEARGSAVRSIVWSEPMASELAHHSGVLRGEKEVPLCGIEHIAPFEVRLHDSRRAML